MIFMRIAIVVLVLLLVVSGAARADVCEDKTPAVSVRSVIEVTKFVQSDSVQDLTEVHGNRAKKNHRVLGTGGGRIGVEAKLQYEIITRNGEACVRLREVNAAFYAYPEIHIASNFRKGSCEYAAVLEHEEKHVETLKSFHREYYPALRKEIESLAGRIKVIGPVSPRDVDKAQKRIESRVMNKISAFSDKSVSILEKRQNKFDTPEEYKSIAARCSRWEDDT